MNHRRGSRSEEPQGKLLEDRAIGLNISCLSSACHGAFCVSLGLLQETFPRTFFSKVVYNVPHIKIH